MKEPITLGLIPARGGSKRLPRKNIKDLCGHPLIAYTIDAARKAKSLTHFLVSSEDGEILDVARRYGAPTPFVRPHELSGDEVRNIQTLDHAMRFMENALGIVFDILVLLQPTCPVRNPAHIDEAVRLLHASTLDSAVSVKGPYKKRDPILKAVRGGVLEDYCSVYSAVSEEPFYLYNASVYAVKRDYFIANNSLISPRQIPVFMDQYHSIDVDTEADFIIAEQYVRRLGKHLNISE